MCVCVCVCVCVVCVCVCVCVCGVCVCVCVRQDIFLQSCETECLQENMCKYESASKETVSWWI